MTVRLPRQLTGVPPSARVHNIAAAELDACARSITVRRLASLLAAEGRNQTYAPANVDLVFAWQTVSGGVNRNNWSREQPAFVRITEAGTYLMLLQVRYPITYNSQDAVGRRWARIMLNGTSPLSDTIGQGVVSATTSRLAGITVQAFACRALQAGDELWCGIRSSHNGSVGGVDVFAADYGGTYFTVARVGPGAGALAADTQSGEGSVPRVASRALVPPDALNIFAQAIDNLGVAGKPRRTTGYSSLPANTPTAIAWQADGLDTRGDMWDPAEPTKLTIRISGTYLLELQVRYPAAGGGGGERWCAIHRGSTTAVDTIARQDKPGVTTFEGTTCVTRAIVKLAAGDVLYGVMGSTVAITAAATTSLGGSYLFAARIGRSGSGGSVLEGNAFDPGPVPEQLAPRVGPDLVAAYAR